jgi:hypothetical protein
MTLADFQIGDLVYVDNLSEQHHVAKVTTIDQLLFLRIIGNKGEIVDIIKNRKLICVAIESSVRHSCYRAYFHPAELRHQEKDAQMARITYMARKRLIQIKNPANAKACAGFNEGDHVIVDNIAQQDFVAKETMIGELLTHRYPDYEGEIFSISPERGLIAVNLKVGEDTSVMTYFHPSELLRGKRPPSESLEKLHIWLKQA